VKKGPAETSISTTEVYRHPLIVLPHKIGAKQRPTEKFIGNGVDLSMNRTSTPDYGLLRRQIVCGLSAFRQMWDGNKDICPKGRAAEPNRVRRICILSNGSGL